MSDDEKWHTSFRFSKEAKTIIKRIAQDYRISNTDVIELILAGKIDVPKVLKELKEEQDYQGG